MTMPQTVYHVVVNGAVVSTLCSRAFGAQLTPAKGEPEGNPSLAVRDSLPTELSLDNGTVLKTLKHPREITCSFRKMRETNKKIWSDDPSVFGEASLPAGGRLPHIDLVLHIGKCTQKKPGY